MIKHIVMIKVKDYATGEKKREVIQQLKKQIDELEGVIEQIRFFETGLNISESAAAFDLVLTSEFDSLEDLNIYRKHPDHLKVLDTLADVKDKITVVDYKFD